MLIDWIATALPLAAADNSSVLDPSLLGSVFSTIGSLLSSAFVWAKVALGIGFVIFVHELGHFVAAKTFGVKCEKFYVGFDVPIKIGPIKFPRTLGKFTHGETEYGIGIIPLGGYVKMLGQDDDPRKQEDEAKRIRLDGEEEEGDAEETPAQLDPRSFPAKPVWQRMIIISAGVVMNVITGVLFAAIAYGYGVSYSPAVVGGVMPGGPAWQAGIEPGGKVVSVGTWSDDQMHFREMRMEILTDGLENPEEPIDIAIEYENGVREFELQSQSRPDEKAAKMIGLAIPNSTVFGKNKYAYPGSVTEQTLSDKDAGASIIAFDSTPINEEAIVPGTPFFDHLYSNPNKTISLTLRRSDDSEVVVDLPPQPAKSIGIRFAIGPVTALVKGGPAEKAGMRVGDVIQSVDDNKLPDAYGLPLDLVGATETVKVTVKRGEGNEAKVVDLEISPSDSPQTIPPTQSIAGEIAINSVGFAYRPLPTVASVLAANPSSAAISSEASDSESKNVLQVGDKIQEVQLSFKKGETPELLKEKRFETILESLKEGWEFKPVTPLSTFRETIQLLPVGTKLTVKVSRPPEDKIETVSVVVRQDDRVMFERGLMLAPSESIQKAGSVTEALSLGFKEGYRQFDNVIRFLKMLPQGRIKLRHVGGPLEIVNMAKGEAEKGISPQLLFLTMLSMNLAILNFLPIPALDGGHMMFLTYELVMGKRANEQLEFRLTVAGLVTLLMLMVVVFANDIMRRL